MKNDKISHSVKLTQQGHEFVDAQTALYQHQNKVLCLLEEYFIPYFQIFINVAPFNSSTD